LPLEIASFITDLVPSNPAHTDGLSQADSHMRLIKSALKGTFPNFTSVPLVSTQAQLDGVALGTAVHTIPMGTAALPGLTPLGDPNTGLFSPAADQLAISLGGTQALLMGGTAIVTSLSIASTSAIGAAAIASIGAYSGGTGQLVPIGAVLEWYDDVLPAEGGYAWANGQIIANANIVCPVLLARWGNKFGGNGTTTMGVPNRCETVAVGRRGMGGAPDRGIMTSINDNVLRLLGALFGTQTKTLGTTNLPPYTPTGTATVASTESDIVVSGGVPFFGGVQAGSSGGIDFSGPPPAPKQITSTGSVAMAAQGGLSTPVNNVQPSTTANFILRLA
jgi:microcystin-dependent protein